jgi:hypothetical protein
MVSSSIGWSVSIRNRWPHFLQWARSPIFEADTRYFWAQVGQATMIESAMPSRLHELPEVSKCPILPLPGTPAQREE